MKSGGGFYGNFGLSTTEIVSGTTTPPGRGGLTGRDTDPCAWGILYPVWDPFPGGIEAENPSDRKIIVNSLEREYKAYDCGLNPYNDTIQ